MGGAQLRNFDGFHKHGEISSSVSTPAQSFHVKMRNYMEPTLLPVLIRL